MQIIKRDGTKVDFDTQRIRNAILKAMKYGSGIVEESIADKIAYECKKVFSMDDKIPTVHMIEDYIYDTLIKLGHVQTAKSYEGYRVIQEYKREINTTDESILKLLDTTNEDVMRENSNKNGYVVAMRLPFKKFAST